MSKSNTSRPSPRLIAVLAVAALFAGSCSSNGSSDAKDESTTTAAAADGSTTTEADDETTTTEPDEDDNGGDGTVTSDDLEAILPTAADLGDGWRVNTKPETADSGPDLDELCPEAAAFAPDEDDDDSDHVKARFINEDNEEITVELEPSAREIDPADLEDYVAALNECEPVTTNDETGLDTAFAFDINTLDEYGDQGMQVEADITVSGEGLPQEVELTLYGIVYRRGTIGVEIMGTDGLDQKTLDVSSFDPDALINLADDLDPKVEELAGS